MGAFAEDLEDQSGTIEHLGTPRLLQIALLYRRERSVDHHDLRLEQRRPLGDLLHLAGTDQRGGNGARQGRDGGPDNIEMDGGGETDSLFQPSLGITQGAGFACLGLDMQHQRLALDGLCLRQYQASGLSWSWIGPSGITVEMECL